MSLIFNTGVFSLTSSRSTVKFTSFLKQTIALSSCFLKLTPWIWNQEWRRFYKEVLTAFSLWRCAPSAMWDCALRLIPVWNQGYLCMLWGLCMSELAKHQKKKKDKCWFSSEMLLKWIFPTMSAPSPFLIHHFLWLKSPKISVWRVWSYAFYI